MELCREIKVDDKERFCLVQRPVKREWLAAWAFHNDLLLWVYSGLTVLFGLLTVFAGFFFVPLVAVTGFLAFLTYRNNYTNTYFTSRAIADQWLVKFDRLEKEAFRDAIGQNISEYWWAGLRRLAEAHDQLSIQIEARSGDNYDHMVSTRDALRQLYFDMTSKTIKFMPYFDGASGDERALKLLERELLEFYESVQVAVKAAADADFLSLANDVSTELPPTVGESAVAAVADSMSGQIEGILALDIYSGRNALGAGEAIDLGAADDDGTTKVRVTKVDQSGS